jgi:hypothetical protein
MSKPKSPWDAARRQPLIRGNHEDEPAPLDPGVRFFVRMLEKLGCRTEWSCEGHPNGFHVVFHGPERVAREIVAAGVFAVRLWHHGGWKITIDAEGLAIVRHQPWTDLHRRKTLRLASELWVDHFGELNDEGYPASLTVDPRDRTANAIRDLAIAADCYLRDKTNADEEDNLVCAVEEAYSVLAADPQTV